MALDIVSMLTHVLEWWSCSVPERACHGMERANRDHSADGNIWICGGEFIGTTSATREADNVYRPYQMLHVVACFGHLEIGKDHQTIVVFLDKRNNRGLVQDVVQASEYDQVYVICGCCRP